MRPANAEIIILTLQTPSSAAMEGGATKYTLPETVRSAVFKESVQLDGTCAKIEGYDFNKGVNYQELFKSMAVTGFQASNLGDAINLVNEMVCSLLLESF